MVPCRSQRAPTFRLTPGGKRVVLADSEVVDHAGEVCAGRAGHRGNKCRVHATMLRTGLRCAGGSNVANRVCLSADGRVSSGRVVLLVRVEAVSC